MLAILGVAPREHGDDWDYIKQRFYREVNRYLRELGEEVAELLKKIIQSRTVWKVARKLAEDLAHAGYATIREGGSIVVDWKVCNYIHNKACTKRGKKVPRRIQKRA